MCYDKHVHVKVRVCVCVFIFVWGGKSWQQYTFVCVCVRWNVCGCDVCGCDLKVEATGEVASPGAAVSARGFYLCTYTIYILSRCNTLKHVYVITLQHTTPPFDHTLQNTAKHCNTAHHSTTYCDTLQCKPTRCNSRHHPVPHTQKPETHSQRPETCTNQQACR